MSYLLDLRRYVFEKRRSFVLVSGFLVLIYTIVQFTETSNLSRGMSFAYLGMTLLLLTILSITKEAQLEGRIAEYALKLTTVGIISGVLLLTDLLIQAITSYTSPDWFYFIFYLHLLGFLGMSFTGWILFDDDVYESNFGIILIIPFIIHFSYGIYQLVIEPTYILNILVYSALALDFIFTGYIMENS